MGENRELGRRVQGEQRAGEEGTGRAEGWGGGNGVEGKISDKTNSKVKVE